MAYVRCAISGVLFECSYVNSLKLPSYEGFPHPIFAASKDFLYKMYMAHCKGELERTDSYLLFLAILHSSGNIEWKANCTLEPKAEVTQILIENNISQLLKVIALTEQIRHPRFKQPRFKVTAEISNLSSLPNWIKAWQENLDAFNMMVATTKERNERHVLEAKLKDLILSHKATSQYARIVADWADKASGGFPAEHKELWLKTISTCFDASKMFKTSLDVLREIKDFCLAHIEVGSIYFNELVDCLNAGITNHTNYLGGSFTALGYSLVPLDAPQEYLETDAGRKISLAASTIATAKKETAGAAVERIKEIISDSPLSPPKKEDYPSASEYIRAKLAYNLAIQAKREEAKLKESLQGL